MAHHKRKGPKSSRAGCLLCKPHKRQGAPAKTRLKISVLRRMGALSARRAIFSAKFRRLRALA